MARNFGTSYHPNEHYMRGPGPACAQNARNILKSNARPASLVHAPAGDAGPPFPSSDGAQDAHQSSFDDARETKRPEMDAGVAPGPSEARFVLSHAEFLAHMESGSQALQNLRTTAFSFLTLGIVALPFFLGAVVYALFFAPSVASVF